MKSSFFLALALAPAGDNGVLGWSTIIRRPLSHRHVVAPRDNDHTVKPRSLIRRDGRHSLTALSVKTSNVPVQAATCTVENAAAVIASSFEPESFDPWLSNRHVQTIGGFFLRDTAAAYLPRDDPVGAMSRIIQVISEKLKSSDTSPPRFWDVRERIETPDGDWFHADTKFPSSTATTISRRGDAPTVLLLHGLESNSDSSLSHQMAAAFCAQGMTVTCLNFRSCSQNRNGDLVLNDKLGFYHMGFTDDIIFYLERMRELTPKTEVFISGFSLGANVVLKALGELGEKARTRYNIQGAAVVCAPLDQERNSVAFSRPGLNRRIYSDGIVQKLQEKAKLQHEAFCDGDPNTTAFDYRGVCEAETISDFDKAFVAPIFGFDDHIDYYRRTSSIHFLEQIAVPTFILNAKDDPFFDNEVFPIQKTAEHGGRAPIKMVHVPSGGHLGFCFHLVQRDDKRLFQIPDNDEDNDDGTEGAPSRMVGASWMPVELARFFEHVMTWSRRREIDGGDDIDQQPRSRIVAGELPAEMNVDESFVTEG